MNRSGILRERLAAALAELRHPTIDPKQVHRISLMEELFPSEPPAKPMVVEIRQPADQEEGR